MGDRPIIFSAPMVRAMLDGRKTQTRRVIKPQPYTVEGVVFTWDGPRSAFLCGPQAIATNLRDHGAIRYAPGDRLYVREAFAKVGDLEDDIHACPDLRIHAYYRADAVDPERQRWRSPIHMPRWASRLTLTVTDVRVQRLQEISEEDARAEGAPALGAELCPPDCEDIRSYVWGFHTLWNSLHGPDAWDQNPWVVAISFTVERRNIDAVVPHG